MAAHASHQPSAVTRTAQLRLLATTDLHLQLTGYDPSSDSALRHDGLAGLAAQIHRVRQEAQDSGRGCLLLDNGDFLQGGALGPFLADPAQVPELQSHPVVCMFNKIGYDAIGLGNHDLDFGLPYLAELTQALRMPVISTNLRAGISTPLVRAALLRCPLPSPEGQSTAALTIGVLSVLPEQTSDWNAKALPPAARITSPARALRRAAPALRRQGADLVILLAHLGLEDRPTSARALAALPGIDAVILGHSHRCYPDPDDPVHAGDDATPPMLQPGHHASHLGQLDLNLRQSPAGRWQVQSHRARLLPNRAPAAPWVQTCATAALGRLRRHLAEPVGTVTTPMQNFFSLAAPTGTAALIARAKAAMIRAEIAKTPEAALPLVAAASAQTAGGRLGPQNYLNLPRGPLLRRHLAGLVHFENEIRAYRVSGRMLRNWLEHSAQVYGALQPSDPDQPLLGGALPSFNFLTLFGLTYRIDPSRPVGRRITALRLRGADLHPEQTCLLATSQFRALGGGGLPPLDPAGLIYASPARLSDAVLAALDAPAPASWPKGPSWRLDSGGRIAAVLQTAPDALRHLDAIEALNPQPCGTDAQGFSRIRLHF